MPYIGNDIRANEDYKIIDDISSGFNNSETSFALQVGGSAPVPFPKFEQQLLISVNGVIQEPDPSGSAGFRLSGTNIVFSSAPTNGHAFFGVIYAGADYLNAGGTFPSGTASVPSITFSSDTDTGIFSPSSGAVAITSNGTKVAQFPTGQGSSGQALVTDGAGVLSFASPSGTTASAITVADESSDTECFPLFTLSATGNLAPKSGSNLKFNSSSGALTATSFVGNLTGDVTGNVSGSSGSCSGTAGIATTITVADESSDTSCNVLYTTQATGNLGAKSGTNLTFNSSNGTLTATAFSGNGASLSNVDAVTVDGIDSGSFLRSDAADTATGLLTLSGGIAVSGRVSAPNFGSHNGGTVTVDFSSSNHHAVNLNQNSTLTHTGTSSAVGQSGSIFLTQDGTGSRTLSFNSAYKFVGGTAPTLSTAANAVDRLDYVVKASNVIHAVVSLDVK